MKEKDLSNRGGRDTLDRANGNALEDHRQDQGGKVGRQSAPDSGQDKQDGTEKVDRALPIENGRRREYNAAKTQSHHVESSC